MKPRIFGGFFVVFFVPHSNYFVRHFTLFSNLQPRLLFQRVIKINCRHLKYKQAVTFFKRYKFRCRKFDALQSNPLLLCVYVAAQRQRVPHHQQFCIDAYRRVPNFSLKAEGNSLQKRHRLLSHKKKSQKENNGGLNENELFVTKNCCSTKEPVLGRKRQSRMAGFLSEVPVCCLV